MMSVTKLVYLSYFQKKNIFAKNRHIKSYGNFKFSTGGDHLRISSRVVEFLVLKLNHSNTKEKSDPSCAENMGVL